MRYLGNIHWVITLACLAATPAWGAQPIVPGTGEKALRVGDDFEDEKWEFIYNLPKSSKEQDEQLRMPWGRSKNGRWYEGNKRGCPDVVRRVATPEGGLPDSKGSLLLQTRLSGIPGEISYKMEQDDIVVNVRERLGGYVPMSWLPSIVVRVYLPPFEKWEHRTGIHFGFRGDCEAWVTEEGKGFFSREETKLKEYWPGIFVQFQSKHDGYAKDAANFLFRAGPQGWDFPGPAITETGWWTLGLSFTADGQVHYYLKHGVENLTEKDYITSQFPYGYQCNRLNNFFFNVANNETGRNWSTPIIIDDPSLYFVRDPQTVHTRRSKPSAATTQSGKPAASGKPSASDDMKAKVANGHQPPTVGVHSEKPKATAGKPSVPAPAAVADGAKPQLQAGPNATGDKSASDQPGASKPKIATSTATDQPATSGKVEAKPTPKVMATKPQGSKLR